MLVAVLVKTTLKVAMAGLIVSSSGIQESEKRLTSSGDLPDKQEKIEVFNGHTYKLLAANLDNIKSGAEETDKKEVEASDKAAETTSKAAETTDKATGVEAAETTAGGESQSSVSDSFVNLDDKQVKANLKAELRSTPAELEKATKANREFTGKVRGSMCHSCLKSLRKDILSKDGVMTVDLVVLQRTRDGSEPEPKVLRIGPDDPPISNKELQRLQKEADALTPREASITVKYIDSKLSAKDLKQTIKSHDFKLATFNDDKITR